jgi:lipopolysaccharide export system permease protein
VRIVDRHLARELVKFAVLACISVVVIYLLIDLFEELNYFTSRKTGLFTILLYYLYSLPAAITLLYPVSMILSVFVVYGQLTRYRERHALESAGVSVVRLFVPAVGMGLASVVIYLVGNELITVPANARLSDLRRTKVEKRQVISVQKRNNVYFVGEQGRVFYIRELESSGVLRNFSLSELGRDRRVVRRIDATEASYQGGRWFGRDVTIRDFDRDGNERLSHVDTMEMTAITEKPWDFARTARPVEETSTRALRGYIGRMKRAGENVAKEEVEYFYRFSYSLIGLVVVLLGLPLSVRMRRGGVMFGLGLGLLFSFLYWGAIQTSRAYGTSHVVSPAMAAWLPNIIFGAAATVLALRVER